MVATGHKGVQERLVGGMIDSEKSLVVDGGWRMEDGGWRVEGGGWSSEGVHVSINRRYQATALREH